MKKDDGLTDMAGREIIDYTPKSEVGKALQQLAEGDLSSSPPKV